MFCRPACLGLGTSRDETPSLATGPQGKQLSPRGVGKEEKHSIPFVHFIRFACWKSFGKRDKRSARIESKIRRRFQRNKCEHKKWNPIFDRPAGHPSINLPAPAPTHFHASFDFRHSSFFPHFFGSFSQRRRPILRNKRGKQKKTNKYYNHSSVVTHSQTHKKMGRFSTNLFTTTFFLTFCELQHNTTMDSMRSPFEIAFCFSFSAHKGHHTLCL